MQKTNVILLDGYLAALSLEDIHVVQEAEILTKNFSADKMITQVSKRLTQFKKILKKHKISPEAVGQKGKRIGKKLEGYYKQGKTPKDVSRILTKEAVRELKPIFYKARSFSRIDTFGENVGVAICSIVVILFISGLLTLPGTIAFGPWIGEYISIVVVAPMVEEAAKNYFIQMDMAYTGTAVVFGFEMATYVYALVLNGMSLPEAILWRTIALGMHFSTTALQKYIMDKRDPNKPEEHSKYIYGAWLAAVGVHMLWNIWAIQDAMDSGEI